MELLLTMMRMMSVLLRILPTEKRVFETYWSADGSSGDDADQRMVTEETRLNHESIRPPLGLLRIQLPHMHALH